ncbi:sensor histidine kinase [Streptomyces corynorhini]|uniref:GAF domain-containing protein n=1 Tax=Streptomyces corynorhini TaxID=2282652 RepID=A0A370B915_9ACTN|nr:GAF domain-containing protein [Streptomyces corynorhini]RDG38121.1 GAF domain-containing protein [Streptomyces corynorhini]
MKVPESMDPLEAATRAAGSLEGLSAETTARVPQLLEAMCSVGAGLGLHATLDRICGTAAELIGARYAAIGVMDETGERLADFVVHGVGEDVARRIGRRPDGHTGVLGGLLRDPGPIRLADLTADPRFAGFPPGHPPMRTFLGVPVQVQGETVGNFYLAEKSGGGEGAGGDGASGGTAGGHGDGGPRVYGGDGGRRVDGGGAHGEFDDYDLDMLRVLANEAGIAIGNARLYEAARQRERWIDGSVAVTTALLSGGDADDALSVVAEQARRLADSAVGVVLLRTPEGGLEIVAVSADHPTARPGDVIPADSPVAATLLAGEAVFVDDSPTDSRLASTLAAGFGPSMLLPLRTDGRVLGALVTPRVRGGRRFGARERVLATQFASQAALALMMAEAQRDRERLAVLEDRDRIARDLHDLVIQRLFATGLMLESAHRGSVAPEVHQGIDKAVEALDVTIQEIRTAIFALQQGSAEAPSGMRSRVLREINMAAVPLGFQPTHHFVGPVDAAVGELPGKNLIAALREALSNAFRHAHATRIEVVLDVTAKLSDGRGAVRLSVADDGVGIPEGGRRSGLRNLRRRAEALGGSSRCERGIGEGPRGGTRVIWEVPL